MPALLACTPFKIPLIQVHIVAALCLSFSRFVEHVTSSNSQPQLSHCNQRRLAVVPQGGNTGLVGGGVPMGEEIVLSLRRMDKIIDFDSVAGVVTAEAGTLE